MSWESVCTKRLEIEKNYAKNKYITTNEKDGAFIECFDLKKRYFYHGDEIYEQEKIKILMTKLKVQEPNLSELHMMLSETPGVVCQHGNPLDNYGKYIWVRAVLKNEIVLPWVCFGAVFCDPMFCVDTLKRIVANDRYHRAILLSYCNNDIPDSNYITVNNENVFVNNKRGSKSSYYGLCLSYKMIEEFKQIQKIDSSVQELHIMSSKSTKTLVVPSAHKGRNVWWRIKNEETTLPWMFDFRAKNVHDCILYCIHGAEKSIIESMKTALVSQGR